MHPLPRAPPLTGPMWHVHHGTLLLRARPPDDLHRSNFDSTATAFENDSTTCAQAAIYAQMQLTGVSAGTECANAEIAGVLRAIGANCCGGCVAPICIRRIMWTPP